MSTYPIRILFGILIWINGAAMSSELSAGQISNNETSKYYTSWTSYQVPLRPEKPIEYAQSEPMTSFYLAHYSSTGELIRFTKYLKVTSIKPCDNLAEVSAINDSWYAHVIRLDSGQLSPGTRIEYRETEHLDAYFRVSIEQGSTSMQLSLVQVKVVFEDEYSYWPNGKLKLRKMKREDGVVVTTSFDPSGKVIAPGK